MPIFLDAFPKVPYDIERLKNRTNYQLVVNILFRFSVIKEILDNISLYYEYTIKDTDTPEIVAEKLYGNAELYWIILYSNNIYDPYYDWPLNNRNFINFIQDKYGSTANAKTTIHHYEKVTSRFESSTGETTEIRVRIDYDKLTDTVPTDAPYDYYTGLAATQSVETVNMNGKTTIETIYRDSVTNYDWEQTQNENKRVIKLINPEYIPQIMKEFNDLTKNSLNPFKRKLI
jgi:hypothetical protein